MIFLGTFFQQIVMISDVARGVHGDLFNVSYTLGASKGQIVRRVLLPATLPGIFDTLRVTMGWAWTFLVVAELVAANAGLGYMILQSMRGFDPAGIFVGIFVIGFLGLGTDLILQMAQASGATLGKPGSIRRTDMGEVLLDNVTVRFGVQSGKLGRGAGKLDAGDS